MKKYIERGVFSGAILTLVYFVVTFITQGYIDLQGVFFCLLGGILSGAVVVFLSKLSAPGEHIPEGEEDKYIDS